MVRTLPLRGKGRRFKSCPAHHIFVASTLIYGFDSHGVLMFLEDGEWHYFKEILDKPCLGVFKLFKILRFLAEYNFIEVKEDSGRIRLTSEVAQFLKEMRRDLFVNMR